MLNEISKIPDIRDLNNLNDSASISLSFSKSTKVFSSDQYNIFKFIDRDETIRYFLTNLNNELCSFVRILPSPHHTPQYIKFPLPYPKVAISRTATKFKGKGYMTILYKFIINELGILYSDYEMTAGGQAIWRSLANSGMNVQIYDPKTGIYSKLDWSKIDKKINTVLCVKKQITEVEKIDPLNDVNNTYYDKIIDKFQKIEELGRFNNIKIVYGIFTDSYMSTSIRRSCVIAIDNDKCVGVTKLIRLHKNYMQSTSFDILPKYRGTGLAFNIYDLIIKRFGLISDNQQTIHTQKLWYKLFKTGRYKMYAYLPDSDQILGEIFDNEGYLYYKNKNDKNLPIYVKYEDDLSILAISK